MKLTIYTNTLLSYQGVAQCTSKANHGTFSSSVVDEKRVALEVVDTRVHADGAALLHVGKRGLSDEEVRVNVHVEGIDPLLSGKFGKLFLDLLSAMIEDKSVDRAELVHMRLDELVAVFLLGKIECDGVKSDFGSSFLDHGKDALHVFLFLRHCDDP